MRERLKALFWLIRPHSCLLASLYILMGIYVGNISTNLSMWRVVGSMMVVFLVVAYSFIVNDYCDYEVDCIAKPQRPLPSGVIPKNLALQVMVGFVVVSVTIAAALGTVALIYVIGTLVFATLYSMKLKQVPFISHMTIGALNASILVFAVAVNGTFNVYVLFLASTVFLYTSSSELLYAVQDREGDLAAGIQTTATIFGQDISLHIFKGMVSVLVVWLLIPWLLRMASSWYVLSVTVIAAVPLILIVSYLSAQHSENRVNHSRVAMKTLRYLFIIPVLLLPIQ